MKSLLPEHGQALHSGSRGVARGGATGCGERDWPGSRSFAFSQPDASYRLRGWVAGGEFTGDICLESWIMMKNGVCMIR